jgi:hypothetical protein
MLPASYPPSEDELIDADRKFLTEHFQPGNYELVVDGKGIDWNKIDSIEVVTAPRTGGPAGWFVKKMIYNGQDRYHVAVYSGRYELVLPNLSPAAVKYVIRTIAYFARQRIPYSGPEGLTATAEG